MFGNSARCKSLCNNECGRIQMRKKLLPSLSITIDQIGELLLQGRAGRITRENLQKFLMDPDGRNSLVYPIEIDYGKTIEEMVKSYKNLKVEHADKLISKNFPFDPSRGIVKVNCRTINLPKHPSKEELEEMLKKEKVRFPTMEEVLSFGNTYPNIHEKDKTICFGPHILFESKTKDKTWDGIPLTPQIEIKNSESKERRISFKYGNEDLNLLEQFGGEISVSHDYYLTVMI
ncbi:MAG TPA: hypothetical protein PKH95_01725 [Candidatus Magasanikbacteria bacterium]|nr:hypothetical protein [Candidatus Magasanikbacteria bacterium]